MSSNSKGVMGVVLLLIAGGVYFFSDRGGQGLESSIQFVCVETGKTFALDPNDVGRIPATNPDTQRATLVPFSQRDGERYMDSHYRQLLTEGQVAELNRYVDANTLAILQDPQ